MPIFIRIYLIIQILGIGLIAAISESLIKETGKNEYGTVIRLVGFVVSIAILIPEIVDLFELIRKSFGI